MHIVLLPPFVLLPLLLLGASQGLLVYAKASFAGLTDLLHSYYEAARLCGKYHLVASPPLGFY